MGRNDQLGREPRQRGIGKFPPLLKRFREWGAFGCCDEAPDVHYPSIIYPLDTSNDPCALGKKSRATAQNTSRAVTVSASLRVVLRKLAKFNSKIEMPGTSRHEMQLPASGPTVQVGLSDS